MPSESLNRREADADAASSADRRDLPPNVTDLGDLKSAASTGTTSPSATATPAEPETAADYFRRGLESAQLGFPDRAAADFEEAAWLAPDDATIQFNLGTAYLSMGMFEQALRNLDRALRLKPDQSDYLGNRAVAHTALGRDDLAEADIARAIELGAPPDGIAAVIEHVKARRQPSP